MKKLILFLFAFLLSISIKAQTIEWHLSNPELPMIMLDENLEPLTSDTNIFPAMYEVIKVIRENGNYITYSGGKDSLTITMLCQVAGQRVACRVIKTPTKLIIQDGTITPAKYEPEEYNFNHFGKLNAIMLGIILFLFIMIIIFNFKKLFNKD